MGDQLDLLKLSAIDFAANGIVITDTSGTILWVNKGFTKLTGYSLEEATGKNPRVLKSGQHDQVYYKHLWDTVIGGQVWHGEITNRRKDGTNYVEEMTITPILDPNTNKPTHFIAVKQDVTARNTAQAQATKNQLFLDSIIENLPLMIFVKEAQSLKFVTLNKAGSKILGIPSQEFVGKSDYDFFPLEQADHFTSADHQVLKDKLPQDIPQETISSKTMGKIILRTRKIPILDDQGNPQYLLGISDDITAEVEAKKQLEEKIRELEKINQVMIDRELRMVELKAEINELKKHVTQ